MLGLRVRVRVLCCCRTALAALDVNEFAHCVEGWGVKRLLIGGWRRARNEAVAISIEVFR